MRELLPLSKAFVNEKSAGRVLKAAKWLAEMPAVPFYAAAGLVTLLTALVAYVPLRGDANQAYAISFVCLVFVLQVCAWCCLPYIQATRGTLRLRWLLFNGGIVMASLCYTIAALQHFYYITQNVAQIGLVVTSIVSEALWLLAATLFFSDPTRSMLVLDWILALLFIVLRFGLTYSSRSHDQFAAHYLAIKGCVAVALTLIAWIAAAGATSRNERRFLHLLAGYLGVRAVSLFIANQISYEWLHYPYASAWDIPATLLYLGYAFYLLRAWSRPAVSPVLQPSLLVRNLMPSFLALMTLAMAVCMLTVWMPIGIIALLVAMGCYFLRTVLLQEQAVRERVALLSRNEELEALAERDALTGLGNRRSLASAYLRMTLKSVQGLAVLLVDTDHFKQTNDRFGHLHGDQVLRGISAVLRKTSEPFAGSHCARFGGDEFAVFLADVTPEEAIGVAEMIRDEIAASRFGNSAVAVTVSQGGAFAVDGKRLALEELLHRADVALYRAKQHGRNCVMWEGLSEQTEVAMPDWESLMMEPEHSTKTGAASVGSLS